jgi:hypothetical protein
MSAMPRVRCPLLLVVALLIVLPAASARGDRKYCRAVRVEARLAGIRAARHVPDLVVQLNDADNGLAADVAYCRLVTKADRAQAIPLLLGYAEDPSARSTDYPGAAYVNPSDSYGLMFVASPSQAMVSLYVVEAIITRARGDRKFTPALVPELVSLATIDQSVLLDEAVTRYQSWYATFQGSPSLRRAKVHPLDGSGIAWR